MNPHQNPPTLSPRADKGWATPGCATCIWKCKRTTLPGDYDCQWYHSCVAKNNSISQAKAGPPAAPATDQQRLAAVAQATQMAARVIPVPCGGGAFLYAGPEGERGAGGVLVEADVKDGFSVNAVGEVSSPSSEAGGGGYTNGSNGANPFFFVPLTEAGGAVAFKGGVGLYVGDAIGKYFGFGAGVYVTFTSVAGCQGQ